MTENQPQDRRVRSRSVDTTEKIYIRPSNRAQRLQAESVESFGRIRDGFYDRTKTRIVYHVCPSSKDSSDNEEQVDANRCPGPSHDTAPRRSSRLVTFNSTNKVVFPKDGKKKIKRRTTFLEKMMGSRDPPMSETPRLREAVQTLIREQRRLQMLEVGIAAVGGGVGVGGDVMSPAEMICES